MALALMVLLLSSCITIEEHYEFNKKGGGKMTYVFDMTEMGEAMDAFTDELEESGTAEDDGAAMDELALDSIANVLKATKGLSKVSLKEDSKWKQSIELYFADISALNRALGILWGGDDGPSDHVFFRKEGNKIIRTHDSSATDLGNNMASDEEDSEVDEVLSTMKYKMSFKFKQEISKVSGGTGAELVQNGKELEFNTDFKQINDHPDALDLSFEFE